MKFTKMHGAGNDYIYFDCLTQNMRTPEAVSIKLSDRHVGVGGDGIVLICPSTVADVKMRMFNADGSEGKMCGNAIRCVAKYVYDRGIVSKDIIDIETLSGVKRIWTLVETGKVSHAKVDMGKATGLNPDEITVTKGQGHFLKNFPVLVDDAIWKITTVSMGNPHCVVFLPRVDDLDLKVIGPSFEKHPFFPQKINTEFVRVIDQTLLEMRVWERGSGETLACGTGACAAVVAAVLNGYCQKDEDVTVRLLGGELIIRVTKDTVFMTGNAVEVFTGDVGI